MSGERAEGPGLRRRGWVAAVGSYSPRVTKRGHTRPSLSQPRPFLHGGGVGVEPPALTPWLSSLCSLLVRAAPHR